MTALRRGWNAAVTRGDIAAALSTLDGVEGVPLPPRVPAPGMGWPVWATRRRVNDFAAEVTYYVYVVLPAGQQIAPESADSLVWPVESALARLGTLVATDPVSLQNGSATGETIPAIRVTLQVTSERPN